MWNMEDARAFRAGGLALLAGLTMLSLVTTTAAEDMIPPPGPPPGVAVRAREDTKPPAERYFPCLQQVVARPANRRHLVVATFVAQPEDNADARRVRIERVIGVDGFVPITITLQNIHGQPLPEVDPDKQYIVSIVKSGMKLDAALTADDPAAAVREQFTNGKWLAQTMSHYVYVWEERRQRSLRTTAVEIPKPTGPWVVAFEKFVHARQSGIDDVEPLDTLEACLKSGNEALAMMASQAACANMVVLHRVDARATRYARLLLAAEDPAIQRNLAKLYFNAGTDVLPEDVTLLKKLLNTGHRDTTELIAIGAVGHVNQRRKQVAAVLAPIFADASRATLQHHLLKGLSDWGKDASLLAEPLEALIRREAEGDQATATRALALQVLLDANADGAGQLARELCTQLPSAVVMESLIEQRAHQAVPRLIKAARAGKLTWSRETALAVAVLTGRLDMLDFEHVDAWWKAVESAGRAEAMVESGFAGQEIEQRAAAIIREFPGADFQRRRRLRQELRQLMPPIPASVRRAASSDSEELRLTARHLIILVGAASRARRDELSNRARAERDAALAYPPRR
jgi:hypothetical protein